MVEFQFYLIFPFVVVLFGKKRFPYIFGVIGIFILTRTLIYMLDGTVQDAAYWTIIGRFDQFAIGMIVAVIRKMHKSLFSRPIWLLLSCVALVGWFFIFTKWCGGYYGEGSPKSTSMAWIVGPTIEAMVYGAFVLAYLHQKWSMPAMIDRSIAYMGAISYSIYIWHFPVVGLFQKYHTQMPFDSVWLNFSFIVFPVVILISIFSYHAIEKPFFSLKTVYIKKSAC